MRSVRGRRSSERGCRRRIPTEVVMPAGVQALITQVQAKAGASVTAAR